MDRIHSAIRKARAARERLIGQDQNTLRPVLPTSPEGIAAAWAAIEEIRPDPKLMERNRLASFSGGVSAVGFDLLRTRILQKMRANNWRRLAITSPGSDSGKTTTCLNLAFSLGRQSDLRSIVIEADMRKPSMAGMLGLIQRHMFAAVLERASKAENHMVRYGANLAFGTNRGPASNPAELLHSVHIGEVLSEIESRFAPDLMIFDMPPMRAGGDTIGFMGQVDCVLLVAAAGSTTVSQVDICEQELAAQTNVLGVVLNKCRYLEKEQGHDYDYHV